MTSCDSRPIGIFDSGLGGLTVAGAVAAAFPTEVIRYLGDTARVPYGTKSPETVRAYARENIAFLLGEGVKTVIAACNTVSAVALPDIAAGYDIPVLGVVEFGAQAAVGAAAVGAAARPAPRIGVIGTETTIASGAYERAIAALAPEAHVVPRACPLLVPLIEEGWFDHPVTDAVIQEYLEPMRRDGVDVLLLGCTHYPLLRNALSRFFGSSVRIVDSAQAMVTALRQAFREGRIVPGADNVTAGLSKLSQSRYYVTDRCNHFQALVRGFMGREDLSIEQISSDRLVEAAHAQRGHSAAATP